MREQTKQTLTYTISQAHDGSTSDGKKKKNTFSIITSWKNHKNNIESHKRRNVQRI